MNQKSKASAKKTTETREQSVTKKGINTTMSRLTAIIGLTVLLGATAPFWHMWADKSSADEFIGFRNFRQFLYAFGIYFAFFCASSFFFWIKHFIDPQYQSVVKIINILGGIFVSISAYFLLWVFIPVSDFPDYVYEIAFVLTAVFIAYGMYLLNRFVARIALNKLRNIKNLVGFMLRVRDKHYERVALKALYAEKRNRPMDSPDTVAENIDEFEEDFYETLEKVDTYYNN